jgi:16S rRNA (guanine1207-N2)-methyltransferase
MASSGAQYFEPKPTAASSRRTQTVALPDLSFTLQTDRGVFSSDGLDTGTRLLLLEAPLPAQAGALLDLGCGAGPIAVTMARRAPRATVWAIDVNERARQLTVDNAADNSLPNISVAAPDDVPEDIRFQTIWSNPPIRIGKAAMHEMLLRWLSGDPRRPETPRCRLIGEVARRTGLCRRATQLPSGFPAAVGHFIDLGQLRRTIESPLGHSSGTLVP